MLGAVLLVVLPFVQAPQQAAPREVVTEVRVHGNQIVSDEEVLQIAAVETGTPFTDEVLAEATRRLKASGRFESIDVVKRFASIEDASRIIVVIIVNEGPVRIVMPGDPGDPLQIKRRTFLNNLMFVPVVEGQDGYGLTFGARVAYPKPIGRNSRLSFPLTWGGKKAVGVELEQTFAAGPLSRADGGVTLQRRRNPAYDINDDRQVIWGRVQKTIGPVRAGGIATWQDVSFGELSDRYRSVGADVTLDTRENPALPRNAVLVTASAERLFFTGGPRITRSRVEATGYIGLIGQHVLILHAVQEQASEPVPPYLRSILGGWSTVRGFETGFLTGDSIAAGSIEWRIPVTSPLSFGKLGVSVFADWGTAWDHGQSPRHRPLYKGQGGTVWFTVASFRLAMAVAYGHGSGTHVHFSGGIGF